MSFILEHLCIGTVQTAEQDTPFKEISEFSIFLNVFLFFSDYGILKKPQAIWILRKTSQNQEITKVLFNIPPFKVCNVAQNKGKC